MIRFFGEMEIRNVQCDKPFSFVLDQVKDRYRTNSTIYPSTFDTSYPSQLEVNAGQLWMEQQQQGNTTTTNNNHNGNNYDNNDHHHHQNRELIPSTQTIEDYISRTGWDPKTQKLIFA